MVYSSIDDEFENWIANGIKIKLKKLRKTKHKPTHSDRRNMNKSESMALKKSDYIYIWTINFSSSAFERAALWIVNDQIYGIDIYIYTLMKWFNFYNV